MSYRNLLSLSSRNQLTVYEEWSSGDVLELVREEMAAVRFTFFFHGAFRPQKP